MLIFLLGANRLIFLLGANRPGAKRLRGRNDQGRNDLGRNAAGAKRLGGELDLGRNDPDSFKVNVKIMVKKYKPDFLSNANDFRKNKLGLNSRSINLPTV